MAGEDRSQNPGSTFGYWQDVRNMLQNGTQLTATEEERWNPNSAPGGDSVNWNYVPQYGWQYKGNQVHGTSGMSSYINDDGERVHYDNRPTIDWNSTEMEHNRALNNARDIWSRGGDVYAQEGGRYSAENPDVEEDAPWLGGQAGPVDQQRSISISEDMRARLSDPTQRDYSGVSSFSQQGRDILNEAFDGRGRDPFDGIMGNSEAVDHLIKKFQDDSFNPLYARGGSANKSDNNMMDYIYREFGGNDQIANRQDVLKRFDTFKADLGLEDKHFMNTRMSERAFNKMGLGDFKEYNSGFSPKTGLFSKVNPFSTGSGMVDGEPVKTKPGGFLDSYLKRRAEEKPSVMSLMKEVEEYK